MKKILIAAAIVASATFANAAYFNWSMNGVNAEDGYFAVAFYCTSKTPTQAEIDSAWATIADKSAFDGDYATIIESGSGQIMAVNEPSKTSGDVYSFVMLVNQTPDDLEGTWNPTEYSVLSGGSSNPQNVGNPTGSYTFTFGASEQGAWQSVPEPTSGLLLLLGVAGLALRRRRA